MPVDPNALFEAIVDGLSKIPSGIFAALLLGGPTSVWLILRFANPRDAQSRFSGPPANPHWVCTGCRSVNELRASSCYRCSMARTDVVLPLIAEAAAVGPVGAGARIAVGPGMPAGSPPVSWLGLGDADDDPDAPDDAALDATAEAIPALVGKRVIREPRGKAAGRRSSGSARRN